MGQLKVKSKKLVVAVSRGTDRRKICQIEFSKKDGSVFVYLPYYKESVGVGGKMLWAGAGSGARTLSLLDEGAEGWTTVHRVKYSHHPNGEAHFSQDGKILTKIRNAQCVRFDDREGDHLFTLRVQGLQDFARPKKKDEEGPAGEKVMVTVPLDDENPPDALRMVCNLSHQDFFPTEFLDQKLSLILLPPDDNPASRLALLLRFVPDNKFFKGGESGLNFYGGFDRPDVRGSGDQSMRFLVISYPVVDIKDVEKDFGSMDFYLERDT